MPSPRTPGVYLEEIPHVPLPIVSIDSRRAAFIGEAAKGSTKRAVRVGSLLEFITAFGPLTTKRELGFAVSQFFVNAGAGASAWIVRVPSKTTEAQFTFALTLLEKLDLFSLLALPGISDASVLASAAELCARRRAMLLIDPPSPSMTPTQLLAEVAPASWFGASHAALYYPWVFVSDPTQPHLRPSAPSGTMAGVIARTDLQRGAWKSPAGQETVLLGVQGLTHLLTEAENEPLNSQGINGLRNLPNAGYVAWGARTLAGPTTLGSNGKYLAVRRTANLIEEIVQRGLAWTVFESNDSNLWSKVRGVVENYLNTLWRAGAFTGAKTSAGFYVRCDQATMTATDVAAGALILEIGLLPSGPLNL